MKKSLSNKHCPWESLFSPDKSNAVAASKYLLCEIEINFNGRERKKRFSNRLDKNLVHNAESCSKINIDESDRLINFRHMY